MGPAGAATLVLTLLIQTAAVTALTARPAAVIAGHRPRRDRDSRHPHHTVVDRSARRGRRLRDVLGSCVEIAVTTALIVLATA